MAKEPGFLSIESAPITGQDDRMLMRQARIGAASVATRFTLASGVINFATSDIVDGGGGAGTLRYSINLYSKVIQYPGYLPQISVMYHPGGLNSAQAIPVPFTDVVSSTAAIRTIINPQIVAVDGIHASSGLLVQIYGYSTSSVFGAQTPGPTSVFSYYVLDGAAEGLVSKI